MSLESPETFDMPGYNHADSWRQRQARRALERQLEYQRKKAISIAGHEADVIAAMRRSSQRVRTLLATYQSFDANCSVLEVGSGAHGLIFFFEGNRKIGVDPLAVEYGTLFPVWQHQAQTIAAFGEELPFSGSSFDIVLSNNVVDHAENPRGIVTELVRVLKPGGLLYFTVNVHHPLYSVAAWAHSTWNGLGLHYEIGPFADHTVHLTPSQAQCLFRNLPLSLLHEKSNIHETKAKAKAIPARHPGDNLKRVFFKNAVFEVIARRER